MKAANEGNNAEYCEKMAKSAEKQARRFKRKNPGSAQAWIAEAAWWRNQK